MNTKIKKFNQFLNEKNIGSKPMCDNIISFSKYLIKNGFIQKFNSEYEREYNSGSFNIRVLIKGTGDELDRTFDIEIPNMDLKKENFETKKEYMETIEYYKNYETSVIGWNLYGEESESKEIFYSEIEEVIQDLNK